MLRPTSVVSSHISNGGFTIIELVVTITVLAILLGIAVGAMGSLSARSQDAERSADTTVITQDLERYYKSQATSTGATYPATTMGATALAALIDDDDATKAPGQSSNSISIATSSTAQTPAISQYIYQPLNLDGSLCTSIPCVRFNLYYTLEETGQTVTLTSMRQQ